MRDLLEDFYLTTNAEGTIMTANRAAKDCFQDGDKLIGRSIEAVVSIPDALLEQLKTLEPGDAIEKIEAGLRLNSGLFDVGTATITKLNDLGTLLWVFNAGEEIDTVHRLSQQQHIIAHLGQDALTEVSSNELIDHIASAICDTLKVDYCSILELLPDDQLLLRGGCGWDKDAGGETIVDPTANASLDQALHKAGLTSNGKLIGKQGSALIESAGVTSSLCVLIPNKTRPFGAVCVHTRAPTAFSPEDESFLQSMAHILAGFLERAQSQEAEREHRVFASALAAITATLTSSLSLDDVLDRILESVQQVEAHDAANLMLVDDGMVRVAGSRGYEAYGLRDFMLSLRFPLKDDLAGPDHAGIDLLPFSYWRDAPELSWIRSNVGAPIRVEGTIIGFLNLDSATPGFFSGANLERLQAFADQAAIAIQNARLYEQAQQAAVLKERQRLSRDLHDAVSQTLWSASLIADVLPSLWKHNPDKAEQKLEMLRELIQGALFEMRALLLELLPSALVEVQLDESVSRLVAAISSRADLPISLQISGEYFDLPAQVQITLYRMIQEALSNTIKHSGAAEAQVNLTFEPNGVEIQVRDNGHGFLSEQKIKGDRFGISIMRSRIMEIGGELKIVTQPGAGTQIVARWDNTAHGHLHDRP